MSTAITPVSNNRSYYSLKEKRNHSNNRIADKHLTADLIENKQENNTANNNDANGNKNDEIIHIQQIDFDIGNSSDLVEKLGKSFFKIFYLLISSENVSFFIANGSPDELANEDNSFSSAEYEKCENTKNRVRNKPNLKLSDLAHKQSKLIDRKIMHYPRYFQLNLRSF